jgi:hypothetical protein
MRVSGPVAESKALYHESDSGAHSPKFSPPGRPGTYHDDCEKLPERTLPDTIAVEKNCKRRHAHYDGQADPEVHSRNSTSEREQEAPFATPEE